MTESTAIFSQKIVKLNGQKYSSSLLDVKIESLIKVANVHGLGVTVFNKNKIVYSKTFGYKNFEKKEPLNKESNIYGASLSKAVFAVFIMKLVENGQIDLDKPLYQYLPKPIYEYQPQKKWHDNYADFKTDTLYKNITARMCLNHTTGLPNWRWDEPDQKLRIGRSQGKRYSYSGEGMVFLQVVLEKYFGKSLEQMMDETIFKPLGMSNSAYTWLPHFEKDFAYGHMPNGNLYEKDKDNEARAASTLETTLADYNKFVKAVLNHSILSKNSTDKMFSNEISIRSIAQFGPLRLRDSPANEAIKLGYGLGWVVLQSPYGTGAFKEGHGDGFQHYSIIFPKKGTGITIMSNSDKAEGIFKELLEFSIGDTYTPWAWENYIPYNSN